MVMDLAMGITARGKSDVTHRNGFEPKAESRHEELTVLGLMAAGGDCEAYEALINRDEFLGRLAKTSRWICRGSTISSEELLSEFFLRLPKKIRKYGNINGASIVSWSALVLRHLHIDLLRSKWREEDHIEQLDELPGRYERTIDTPDSRYVLNQAFKALTEREKKLLALRWREETLDDIVAAIDDLSDPRDIQNRRPKISRELKTIEQRLRKALAGVDTGRIQGSEGPLKPDY